MQSGDWPALFLVVSCVACVGFYKHRAFNITSFTSGLLALLGWPVRFGAYLPEKVRRWLHGKHFINIPIAMVLLGSWLSLLWVLSRAVAHAVSVSWLPVSTPSTPSTTTIPSTPLSAIPALSTMASEAAMLEHAAPSTASPSVLRTDTILGTSLSTGCVSSSTAKYYTPLYAARNTDTIMGTLLGSARHIQTSSGQPLE